MPDCISYEYAVKSIEKSVKSLDLEYLDLVLIDFDEVETLTEDDPENTNSRIESWRAVEEAYIVHGTT